MALYFPAQTYITLGDARAYAELFDLSLPEDDEAAELLLKRAAIYLDRLYGARYIGNKTTTVFSQSLYFPRTLNYYDSLGNYRPDFTETGIPVELGQAQVELAAMLLDDFDPFVQEASTSETTIKLDEIESTVKYAGSAGYTVNPLLKIDAILAPLIRVVGARPVLRMVRGG